MLSNSRWVRPKDRWAAGSIKKQLNSIKMQVDLIEKQLETMGSWILKTIRALLIKVLQVLQWWRGQKYASSSAAQPYSHLFDSLSIQLFSRLMGQTDQMSNRKPWQTSHTHQQSQRRLHPACNQTNCYTTFHATCAQQVALWCKKTSTNFKWHIFFYEASFHMISRRFMTSCAQRIIDRIIEWASLLHIICGFV